MDTLALIDINMILMILIIITFILLIIESDRMEKENQRLKRQRVKKEPRLSQSNNTPKTINQITFDENKPHHNHVEFRKIEEGEKVSSTDTET